MDRDFLEFVVGIKETVSGSAAKMAATTRGHFAAIEAGAEKMGAGFVKAGNTAGSSMGGMVNNLNNVERAAGSATAALAKMGAEGARAGSGMGIGSIAAGSLISNGIQQLATTALEQTKHVIGLGMNSGMEQAQFNVLAKDRGPQLYKDVTKYVNDSVFGPELYQDARTMLAYGVKAKEIMPDMKMLGDVAMGNAEKMKLLTLAFSQTTAAGKLMGQDLLQYVNAGFNPLMTIAEHTGKKYEDLKDAMSEGKITADMVRQAFIIATSEGGQFYGMLDEMAKMPGGKAQAMEGNAEGNLMAFGNSLMPDVNKLLDAVKPLVDDMPAQLEQLRPVISDVVAELVKMAKWLHENWDTVRNITGAAKTLVEAWIAWKVATATLTAAKWLLNAAFAAEATEVAASTVANNAENVALGEQIGLVGTLDKAYKDLAVSRGAYAAEAEAAAALQVALPSGIGQLSMGAAAKSTGAAAVATGSAIGTAAKELLPVAIMFMAADVLWKLSGLKGDDRRPEEAVQDYVNREKLRKHPIEAQMINPYASWDWMVPGVDGGKASDAILDKWGDYLQPKDKKGKGADKSFDDITHSITGGGKRQIVINVNAPMYQVDTQNFNNTTEHIEDMEGKVEEALLRNLQSAKAAAQ